MTKTTSAILALTALLGLAACGGAADPEADAADQRTTETVEPTVEAPERQAPATDKPTAATVEPTVETPEPEAPVTAKPTTTTAAPTTTEPERIPVPTVATVAPQPKATDAVQVSDVFVYQQDDYFYFGAIVNNTGDKPLVDVEIDVDSFDDTGRLIDSTSDYIDAIFPGTPYVIYSMTEAGQPTQVQVTPNEAAWFTGDTAGGMTVENVNLVNDDYSATLTGDVRSTFSADQEYVSVMAVWKDANGAVVRVEETYVDKLLAGQVSAFDIMVFVDDGQEARVPDLLVANL